MRFIKLALSVLFGWLGAVIAGKISLLVGCTMVMYGIVMAAGSRGPQGELVLLIGGGLALLAFLLATSLVVGAFVLLVRAVMGGRSRKPQILANRAPRPSGPRLPAAHGAAPGPTLPRPRPAVSAERPTPPRGRTSGDSAR